jgi:Cupredoxin-like domain
MKLSTTRRHAIGAGALVIALLAAVAPVAWAEDAATVRLSLKDHRFIPAEARAPAGKPITIEIKNLDPTPAEFESKTLRVEKVVAGGGTISVQIRPLAAGRYRFFDDYHEDTTEGFLNVQ